MRAISRSFIVVISSPKIFTEPEVGFIEPMICRSNVLLPQPLPPIITSVSPRSILNEISLITVRSANLRTRSTTSMMGESGMRRMTKKLSGELRPSNLVIVSCLVILLASPNVGKDQVQFFGFNPRRSSLRLQCRHCAHDHAEKMFRFARFFPACTDTFQKSPFSTPRHRLRHSSLRRLFPHLQVD